MDVATRIQGNIMYSIYQIALFMYLYGLVVSLKGQMPALVYLYIATMATLTVIDIYTIIQTYRDGFLDAPLIALCLHGIFLYLGYTALS